MWGEVFPTPENHGIYAASNSPIMSFYIPFGESQTDGFKLLAYLKESGSPVNSLTATVYPDNCSCGYGQAVLSHPLRSVVVSGVGSTSSWVSATFSSTLVGGDYYWVQFSSSTNSGNPYVVTTNQNGATALWIKSLTNQNVTIYPIYSTGNNWDAIPGHYVYFEVSQQSNANTVIFSDSDRAYDTNNITVYLEYPNGTILTTATMSQQQTEGQTGYWYGVPYQFAKTVVLYPNIKYQFDFSSLPRGDEYDGSIGGGITQSFITDTVNPASAGYLGQGYFPVFQIGYMTLDLKDSNLHMSPTDLFDSPGYQGTTNEIGMRFVPTQSENLQGFSVEVLQADVIAGATLNVTLRADNTIGGSHPIPTSSGSVIAAGSITFSAINATFKSGPTWSGKYAWANVTFVAKPGHTLGVSQARTIGL